MDSNTLCRKLRYFLLTNDERLYPFLNVSHILAVIFFSNVFLDAGTSATATRAATAPPTRLSAQ